MDSMTGAEGMRQSMMLDTNNLEIADVILERVNKNVRGSGKRR